MCQVLIDRCRSRLLPLTGSNTARDAAGPHDKPTDAAAAAAAALSPYDDT